MFCGKANLSKFLRHYGFQVFSVDHKGTKGVPILQIDINVNDQRMLLEELLLQGNVLYIHFAPPCGTCSAARSIRLSRSRHGPKPLRSMAHPMGLKNLTPIQSKRVRLANQLYEWTVCVILKLDPKGIWSVENPSSSLMWMTTPFQRLMRSALRIFGVSFHTCMYNAPRKKTTALWGNFEEIKLLARTCDNNHVHQPWGVVQQHGQVHFATAEECAYNDTLAAAWASVVWMHAQTKGITKDAATFDEVTLATKQTQVANKAIAGLLPRGRHILPLMPDFTKPKLFNISGNKVLQTMVPGKRIPDSCGLPLGSKLVNFVLEMSNGECEKAQKIHSMKNAGGYGEVSTMHDTAAVQDSHGLYNFARIGIPSDPMEFLRKATHLKHPILQIGLMSGAMKDAFDVNDDALRLRKTRLQNFAKMVSKAKALEAEEQVVHGNMPPHLRMVLRGKRVMLFEELLQQISYPDTSIAREMREGFPLYGWLPVSNVFPSNVRVPVLHVSSLESMAHVFSRRTLSAVKSSGDKMHDEALWAATLQEVEAGYLEGPYEVSELPSGSIISPRFGLAQKNKLRPIDNMSASGINSAVGLPEKLQVEGVDEAISVIRAWMMHTGSGCHLLGKTYDLRKAYRQIGIAKKHLLSAWIAAWNPATSRPMVFAMKSMPFGATASVQAFLRLSVALKTLGTMLFHFVWTSYYDDFIVVCKKGDEENTDRMVRQFFSTLGWELSSDAEKDRPFDSSFSALGVRFDLGACGDGRLLVSNTEGRRGELTSCISDILESQRLTVVEATSLRSRLLFAESQIFGRMAKQSLKVIGGVGLGLSDMSPLSPEVVQSLEWIRDRVLKAPPREINIMGRDTYHIFLDGACTPKDNSVAWSGTSIGGVLCVNSGNILRFFGEVLPDSITSRWSEGIREQLVYEAEVLPYSVALSLWQDYIRDSCLFVYIDNEASRFSWIAGTADRSLVQKMIHRALCLEADISTYPYFNRVPSHSNLADDPSRGKFDTLLSLGGVRDRIPLCDLMLLSECG